MNGNTICCLFTLQLFAYFAYFYPNFCFKKIFLTRFRSLINLNFKKCSFKLSFTKSIASTNYGTANTQIIYLKKISWALWHHGSQTLFLTERSLLVKYPRGHNLLTNRVRSLKKQLTSGNPTSPLALEF